MFKRDFQSLSTASPKMHETAPVHFDGNAMTLDYRVSIGQCLSSSERVYVGSILACTFAEINATFNKWNPHSEISLLNRLPAGHKVPLSPQLHSFLCGVSDIVVLTDGLFDPTVLPLYDLWQKHLQIGSIPDENSISEVAKCVGWDKIHIEDFCFSKDYDGTALDLGGIAKGHCVDLLVERLNAAGYAHIFVDWSGEIRTSGHHPEGRPWVIAIQSSEEGVIEQAIPPIAMYDDAIATSGDYNQNWTVFTSEGETTYFHIIHPKLHRPLIATANSITSASVRAKTCALADALASTLLMFPSIGAAQSWVDGLSKKISPLEVWILPSR
jgi:thiamine biosynthesis lipoprotein